MQRIFTGFGVAALMVVLSTMAMAGNQELADQIAKRLRDSGQMNSYKIGIKCQDGTVWLRGQVTSEEQMNTALKVAFQTTGVKRVVNELSMAEPNEQVAENAQPSQPVAHASQNPLRGLGFGTTSRQPQKQSFVKRLESVMTRNPDPSAPAQVDRLANSYHSSEVTPVSAEEATEEAPQAMRVPVQARPVAGNHAAYNQGRPMPMYTAANSRAGVAPTRYDQPCMPNYAWPSYAAYPNYAAVTYPKQYSPTAWPYIGPFYPYPQVPLGWRKVTLEWDDGWWFLDFKDQPSSCWHR
jgi:hypothetical protein